MSTLLAGRKSTIALGAFVAGVVAYPLLLPGSYPLGVGISAGVLAVASVGYVLLLGYAHQLAIGHAAFAMIGGYANAILCVDYGWDSLAALIAGVVVSSVLAYAVASPILKLRGFVLAMASLALHLILIVFAVEMTFTGGALGRYGLQRFALFGMPLATDLAFYFFVWFAVLLAVAIGLNIDRSRIGRALKGIAVSEAAAGSVGIDIDKYKLQMFVVAAAMASVSGSLAVHYLRAMDPLVFSFAYTLNLLTAVIIGGLMSIWGGPIGAVVIIGLRELLRDLSLPLWEAIIMGGLTVVVLIAFPRGIAGFVGGLFDRAAGSKRSGRLTLAPPDPSAVAPFAAGAEAASPMLEVSGVSRAFGSLRAVADVSFIVGRGSITALIGPNGAGKTTLFNLINGYQPLDAGTVVCEGRRIDELLPDEIARLGIGRTFQLLQLFDNMTVLQNVMCGRHRLMSGGVLDIALGLPRIAREENEARGAARDCLRFVGLADAADLDPSALAFGHQRLVEVARALALQPRFLLLDEPASGLNEAETERLAEIILRIVALGVTVLVIEHDMRLVMGIADRIVVMHHGEKIAEGPADLVRADRRVIAAYLGQEVEERAAGA